jgi:2-amino-4-hydroxy-6-hydroxymethyldihydropteridine diphosphokinase
MVEREGQDGTWIQEELVEAYTRMHKLGYAHSFEAYYEGKLVGGLYGLSLGKAFFGESMFATMPDASKVCFASLVEFAIENEFLFIDAQQETSHLSSLGAKPIPIEDFLSLLFISNQHETLMGKWSKIDRKTVMSKVTFLIGGNQGDRETLLERACKEIELRIGKMLQVSSIYETEAWGFEAEQSFLNQAVVVETDLLPEEVLRQALNIEAVLGRVRNGSGYASRTMDIDVMYIDDKCISTPSLIVPHPRIQERNFVLEPLCEIMPNFVHPILQKTMQELLEKCSDNGKVSLYKQGKVTKK